MFLPVSLREMKAKKKDFSYQAITSGSLMSGEKELLKPTQEVSTREGVTN